MSDLEGMLETAMSAATRLKVDDAVVLAGEDFEKMMRFANDSATVVKEIQETQLVVYLAKEGRRTIASTSNTEPASVKRFVGEVFASMKGSRPSEYGRLSGPARNFGHSSRGYDKKIKELGRELPELAGEAIESAKKSGSKRSAGVVTASASEVFILTSAGTRGSSKGSSITVNIRAFSDGDASGHGLSCSSDLAGFDPALAGRKAGADAKRMVGAKEPEAGSYDVLLSPTVSSNLIERVVDAASAFSVEIGQSFLAEKLGKRVGSELVSIYDHGSIQGGLGGRPFDDEGTPTSTTKIIEGGVLKGYLHNLTTAMRSKASSTGSAGLIDPHPWNVEVKAGSAVREEMVKEMKKGIVLTNNWYTRFKNPRTGEFSTVPRDGAFLVEDGKIIGPLKGMRMGDALERMLTSVKMLSRSREWIQWWEVNTPTLCPWMLVEGAKITRAFE